MMSTAFIFTALLDGDKNNKDIGCDIIIEQHLQKTHVVYFELTGDAIVKMRWDTTHAIMCTDVACSELDSRLWRYNVHVFTWSKTSLITYTVYGFDIDYNQDWFCEFTTITKFLLINYHSGKSWPLRLATMLCNILSIVQGYVINISDYTVCMLLCMVLFHNWKRNVTSRQQLSCLIIYRA